MRKILISIKQKWADAILDGRKTVELRKNRPAGKADASGYLHARDVAYIVSTPGKHVIGKCIVNLYTHCEGALDDYAPGERGQDFLRAACVTRAEYEAYAPKYTWELSRPARFKRPVELSAIEINCAPQSWQYLTDWEAGQLEKKGGLYE